MGMWRDFQPAQQKMFLKTITYGTFKTDIKYITQHSDCKHRKCWTQPYLLYSESEKKIK